MPPDNSGRIGAPAPGLFPRKSGSLEASLRLLRDSGPVSMRFPRGRRITSRRLFQRVRREGSSYRGHYLILGVLHDPGAASTVRVGYITTKRVGKAVTRNAVRRRLRGILQRTGERLQPGYCLVIIARDAAAAADSAALEKEWKWLAHRAKILQPRERADSA